MKQLLFILLSLIMFFWFPTEYANSISGKPLRQSTSASADNSRMAAHASSELLIGWKAGVSDSERDEIIERLGGRLKHRFNLVKADLVLFDSSELGERAVQQAQRERAIKHLLTNEDISVRLSDDDRAEYERRFSTLSESSPEMASEMSHAKRSLSPAQNIKKFKTPYIFPFYRVHESLEFATQKKDILVAVIEDGARITSKGLKTLVWENPAEKNGIPGIDDDNNGWVDDIYGINPLGHRPKSDSFTNYIASYVAATADYSPDKPANPKGKVKLLPIAAFYRKENNCRDYYLASNDAVLIQSIEYASKMGAQIIIIPEYDVIKPEISGDDHSLLLEAVAAFPGLIITDNGSNDYCYDQSVLLNAGFPHVIGVGGDSSESGPVDLYADDGAMVAGVAANLMSCYPHLDRLQIKDLLLGSVNQHPLAIDSIRTGGLLDATRAVLGRSAGGRFYIGDWARIDREGPPVREFSGYTYDSSHGRFYLYGGSDPRLSDDFWVWNGKRWKEIVQDKTSGHHPEYGGPLYYDEKRDQIVLMSDFRFEWRWDGEQWHYHEAPIPEVLDPKGRELRYNRLGNYNSLYDPIRDRLVYFCFCYDYDYKKVYSIFMEYNWDKWRQIPFNNVNIFNNSSYYSNYMYESIDDKFVLFEGDGKKKRINRMWSYDGSDWHSEKIPAIPGSGGIVVYNPGKNQFWRFGSTIFLKEPSSAVYSEAFDVVRFNTEGWEHLGYDLPITVKEKGVWAADQNKFLLIGQPSVFGDYGTGNGRFSLWQYSGSITPTWIDNMILPQSDYTGDGKADPALWHPGTGEFCLLNGTVAAIGKWGDTPVPGDYDGDGSIDFAVCRRLPDRKMYEPDDGPLEWIFTDKKLFLGRFYDIPVPLDYDGDGKTDIAVFRKDTAEWIFQNKKKNTTFGNPADLPVPADYDGDGRVELATYTPLTSTWHIQGIGDIQYGKPGDSPVPADYDGDGRADIATWNPRTRQWLVRDWSSGGNLIKQRIGSKWDIPVPGDYNGDGKVELATFNPITARWNIQGRTPFTFGTAGDVPLVRGN